MAAFWFAYSIGYSQSKSIFSAASIMVVHDPLLNSRKVRKGLVEAIRSGSVEYSNGSNSIIVLFDVKLSSFEAGRIHLFQDCIYSNFGIFLEVQKIRNACLKVYFDATECASVKSELREFFESTHFSEIAKALEIAYLQYSGKIFRI